MLIWFALGAVLGALRVLGHKSQAFQAAAHLYMGAMGATWWYTRNPALIWLFVGLSVLEVVCFVVQHRKVGTTP